jgi:hypothetical protein
LTKFQRDIRVGDVAAIKLIAEKSNLIF